ncbi:MAG TPA: hypothetical protein HPP97_14625 [Desulfuromonadales bacterium]|nr:hypothetical protein [Desulfuromonadales bacterium]
MTSFSDPMQELNQKVLEKQAGGLLAEIERNMLAGNFPAAFERLYFYISQNHSTQAASSVIEKFPETAVVFSAREALLAFANRDKTLACWQAFIEAEKLVAAGAFDEATTLLRRARAGFAGAPEFAKIQDAWTTAKADQLRQALMRGDEQTAGRVEKEIEIDCKIAAVQLIENVKKQFKITFNQKIITKTDNGFKLLLNSEEFVKAKYLNNYGNKLFFIKTNSKDSHSIIVIDLNEANTIEYYFTRQFAFSPYNQNFFEVDESNNIYGLISDDFEYIRFRLDGDSSAITMFVDISSTLDTTSATDPWVSSLAQHKSNNDLLYFTYDTTCGNENDTEKFVSLDLIKNTIIYKHDCNDESKQLKSPILIPGSTPTFIAGYSDEYTGLYNNKFILTKRISDKTKDYFSYIKCKGIDYLAKSICFIAEGSDEKGDERYDLFETDFDLNIKEIHANIFSSSGWWHEENAQYDTANGLVYFEGISLQVYDYKNKRYILTFKDEYRTQLIYFKQNNKPYIWEVKDNTLNIIECSGYILELLQENETNSELASSRHLSAQNSINQSHNKIWEPLLESIKNKPSIKRTNESQTSLTLITTVQEGYERDL